MKIISFTCCHYGSDYLGWAIKSVYPFVDEAWVVYSEKPSHGHGTALTNPDSREAVKESLYRFGDPEDKIKWTKGTWAHEGHHRQEAYTIARKRGADMIVVVDADEVWQPQGLQDAIKAARDDPAKLCKAHMVHFWRSFDWVCRDGMTPDRVRCLGASKEIKYLPTGKNPIYHFGYARELKHIKYKIAIHGHKAEWRKDWLERYSRWRPGCDMKDVHPTCKDIWTPMEFDKTTLPEWMRDHPYYDKRLI